jgi:hypothetical protein
MVAVTERYAGRQRDDEASAITLMVLVFMICRACPIPEDVRHPDREEHDHDEQHVDAADVRRRQERLRGQC